MEKVEIGDYVVHLSACVVFHGGQVSPASRKFVGTLYIGMGGIQCDCVRASVNAPLWRRFSGRICIPSS